MNNCGECKYLDKQHKKWNDTHYCYTYGCLKYAGQNIVGWVQKDSELSLIGCSRYEEDKPITQMTYLDTLKRLKNG